VTIVDAHQHLWDLERGKYEWLSPEYGPLYRTFTADELEPQLRRAGVDATVLVQAADTLQDTESMLAVADRVAWVAGVVGWVPLTDPAGRDAALERFTAHSAFRGVRHLIHEEPDPDWVLQDAVRDGLRTLAARGLTFDVVAVLPRHLEHVPILARAIPDLRIVVDHLAKPPIKDRGWQPWADLLAAAAEHGNVFAKVSGLNTAADPEHWTATDLAPYIDHALACFGAERLMFGGDWPVAILAGDYQKVWEETNRALAGLSDAERAAVLGGTALHFYGLRDRVGAER
jgi:L-fuconolactonase